MALFKTKKKIIQDYLDEQKKEENVVVMRKNRHIAMLEKIIDSLEQQITTLTEKVQESKSSGVEDRFLDILEDMLSNKKTKTVEVKKNIVDASPSQFSDQEIMDVLNRVSKKSLARLVSMGEQGFGDQVKVQIPDISDESLKRAYDLAKEMINNG